MKNEQKNEAKEMVQAVNEVTKAPKKNTVKSLLESENMKARIQELLKDRASSFITSVIQLVQQDKALAECEP
uniref:hypothetical protein n=1 Tax=Escherichia coli TaxID=562 RepID=UPI00215A5F4F